jgi:hypothetical protein
VANSPIWLGGLPEPECELEDQAMTSLDEPGARGAEIAFTVAGWPPIKNEAKSMLASGHQQAKAVRALLLGAGDAAQRTGWTVISGLVALELVIRGPGRPPGDATNYLGGVADALQDKSRATVDLTHLGTLAEVALYVNDRQISRITYREGTAPEWSYEVRITANGPATSV